MEVRPLGEQELIERALEGDTSAFGELVATHQRMALRVAYLVMRDPTEAEDVTQDAFIKAYQALPRFRQGSAFRPWLLTIVRNEAVNRLRGRRRREQLALRMASESAATDSAPSAEAVAASDESHRLVLEAVDRLPSRYRDTIMLRYLLEMEEKEVAVVLGIPVGTVKSRSSRGLVALRSLLTEVMP